MRRREKEIQNRQVVEELLHNAPVCRIGLAPGAGGTDGNGYPYVLPVHFVYSEGRILIHTAREGRKIDMLRKNPELCVEIDEYLGLTPAEKACGYGSRYRSLIAFGRAKFVEAEEEKRRALQMLMEKYTGRSFDFSARDVETVGIIEIKLDEITGKQGV
jgi:nitroimidazol reductase NimA-like FMN-containing flavoprotein (pyridoxamine 5'-phosphate oxidase superfamily)